MNEQIQKTIELLEKILYCGEEGLTIDEHLASEIQNTLAMLEEPEKPDKYKHKPGCNPKPWNNECICGVLKSR